MANDVSIFGGKNYFKLFTGLILMGGGGWNLGQSGCGCGTVHPHPKSPPLKMHLLQGSQKKKEKQIWWSWFVFHLQFMIYSMYSMWLYCRIRTILYTFPPKYLSQPSMLWTENMGSGWCREHTTVVSKQNPCSMKLGCFLNLFGTEKKLCSLGNSKQN